MTKDELIEAIGKIIHPGAWEPQAVNLYWEMWVRDAQNGAREKARSIIRLMEDGKPLRPAPPR